MNGHASSKCCLEDTIEMRISSNDTYEKDVEEFLSKTKIFLKMSADWKMEDELNLKTYKDVLPYYPRCEGIATFSDGKNTILLSSKPHWRWEELEHYEFIYKEVLRVYNRIKRKKGTLNEEFIYNELSDFYKKEEHIKTMIERVFKSGKKADYSDLRSSTKNSLYRKPLYEEMVRVGYTPSQAYEWVYNNNKTW